MKKRAGNSSARQTRVLTSRYLKIFFNDKQGLILTIAIPLLTILIVCSVACGDMYSAKTKTDHFINEGYPVLSWQNTPQEKSDEFTLYQKGIGKKEDENIVYVIFEKENDYYEFSNEKFNIIDESGEETFSCEGEDIIITTAKDKAYSAYAVLDESLNSGKKYTVTFSADCENSDGDSHGNLSNEFDVTVPDEYEDISSIIDKEGEAYKTKEVLEDGFELSDYVRSNSEKIASLSKATMKIDGKDYVLISDAQTLAFVLSDKTEFNAENAEWAKYNYYLNCDIDMNGYDALVPLGDYEAPFSGVFDGNGHIIKNFKIKSENSYSGLTGVLTGSVKNLGLEKIEVNTSKKYAGAFAGLVKGSGSVYNSYVKDSDISADDAYAGSITGGCESANAIIYNCYSRGLTITSDENVGGLVGDLQDASLKACYCDNEINGDANDNTGIIVGSYDEDAVINNCYYIENGESEYTMLGSEEDDRAFCNKNSIKGIEAEDFKTFSEKIILEPENPDNDAQYGFKKDGQLDMFNGTQTGLFMLSCVAIFVGICNSIQEICKERNILKREYMTNLNLVSYVFSKLIVQALICAAQTALILVIFGFAVRNKTLPSSGVIFGSIWTEYFITMFLLTFAADTMALVVSSLVKNSSTANTFIPIILIVQIVFSGVLFDLGDAMEKFASLMVSKWGIAGLAISSRLNNSRTRFLLDSPSFELQLGPSMSVVKDLYRSTVWNLLFVWLILIAFIVVCSVLCTLLLRRVKKDKR